MWSGCEVLTFLVAIYFVWNRWKLRVVRRMVFAKDKVTAMECDIATCVFFGNESSKVADKTFIWRTHHSQHFLPTFHLNYRNYWDFLFDSHQKNFDEDTKMWKTAMNTTTWILDPHILRHCSVVL